MIGPLPYFTLGPWDLGPITIHAFGVFVAIGLLLAQSAAVRRGAQLGVSAKDMTRAVGYMLIAGFLGEHFLNVLFYEPQRVLEDPWALVRVYESMSSFGGLLGALIGLAIFRVRFPAAPFGRIADAAAFVLPIGWLFGRIGCSFAHDHPGRLTDFFLAVDFGTHGPGGVRHDLGLYEAIWWVVIVVGFVVIDRWRSELRTRARFYPGLLAVTYAPMRFLLDFLRAGVAEEGDARYLGLHARSVHFDLGVRVRSEPSAHQTGAFTKADHRLAGTSQPSGAAGVQTPRTVSSVSRTHTSSFPRPLNAHWTTAPLKAA